MSCSRLPCNHKYDVAELAAAETTTSEAFSPLHTSGKWQLIAASECPSSSGISIESVYPAYALFRAVESDLHWHDTRAALQSLFLQTSNLKPASEGPRLCQLIDTSWEITGNTCMCIFSLRFRDVSNLLSHLLEEPEPREI